MSSGSWKTCRSTAARAPTTRPPSRWSATSRADPCVAALRAFEPHILAQRRAFVFGTKETARLQFRDHQRDKIVEPARQMRGMKQKPVDSVTAEPFLHIV